MDQETTEILIRFKEKKVASGLSASKLAEILGYGKSAVEHWLNQHNAPNDEALERIKKWIDQDDTQINETTNQDILDHVDQ